MSEPRDLDQLDCAPERSMTEAAAHMMAAEEVLVGSDIRARAERLAKSLTLASAHLGHALGSRIPPGPRLMAGAALCLVRGALRNLVLGDQRQAAECAAAAVSALHSALLERPRG